MRALFAPLVALLFGPTSADRLAFGNCDSSAVTVMSSIMADKNKQEEKVMSAGADLEYCIVRPGGLKSDPPTGIVTAGKDQEAGAIARADVAAFCLDAVIEEDFKFLNQAVSISSNMGSGFDSVLADKTKSRMAK